MCLFMNFLLFMSLLHTTIQGTILRLCLIIMSQPITMSAMIMVMNMAMNTIMPLLHPIQNLTIMLHIIPNHISLLPTFLEDMALTESDYLKENLIYTLSMISLCYGLIKN